MFYMKINQHEDINLTLYIYIKNELSAFKFQYIPTYC